MKILLVGSDKVWSIENHFHKYFNEFGADTKLFPAQSIFYNFHQKNIINKILYRLGLTNITKAINTHFKKIVDGFKPNVVLVFKGMEIFPETLQWLKQQNIFIANYNPDNPFIFTGRGSGNSNITQSLPLYDLHLTYNVEIEQQLKQQLNIPTGFLPFGFELSEEVVKECEQQPEIIKCCFLGNPDKDRAALISELADKGIDIDVFGNDWNKFVSHKNITTHPPVYGNDLWGKLRQYRVQLNIMRVHNLNSHNMRTFEVPGVGGIMIAPDTVEHRMFYEEGKEVFLYSSTDECVTKMQYILNLPKADADAIRFNARQKCLQQGYTYKGRAASLLHMLQKHCNN